MLISGCVKEITSLPKELTGLGIPSLLSTHHYHSPIRQIWNDSKGKHFKVDSLLNENDNIKAAQKSLKIDQIQKAKSHFFALESQELSARTVTQNIPKKRILFWSTYIESLPGFLYNFVWKAYIQQLPTSANLARWKRTANPFCNLCHSSKPETNKHISSNMRFHLKCWKQYKARLHQRWIPTKQSPDWMATSEVWCAIFQISYSS